MKKLLSLTALSVLLFTSANAFAFSFPHQGYGHSRGHHYGWYKNRNNQYSQCNRIQQGIRSGQLTRFEARRLGVEGQRIAHVERLYRADGYLSPQERNRLQNLESRYSKDIYRQKHDGHTLP